MSDRTTNLMLPFLASAQAQKHVTVNESLRRLDALVQLAVVSATTSTEPGSPSDGQVYILPAGKTGTHWGAMTNLALAYYRDGAWEEIAPREGFTAWVKDADKLVIYSGSAWADAIDANAGPSCAPCGRLTLSSGVAVPSSDVTGASTIYYTPSVGNRVPLYDGATWRSAAFAELSNATAQSSTGKAGPAAVANNSNYDLFVWDDAGTLRLTRGPAWTSDTGRGTGAGTTQLTLTNGVYLNTVAITNGPAALRGTYVGTVRSDGSAQINDSAAKRMVWNAANRRPRKLQRFETTTSWTYSSASYQQANASTANQVAMVRGLDEDDVALSLVASFSSSGATVRICYSGIGLDGATTNAGLSAATQTNTAIQSHSARYEGAPGLGYHYLAWLERGDGNDTQTWYGQVAANVLQSGLQGTCFA